jgi:hypothetical protein
MGQPAKLGHFKKSWLLTKSAWQGFKLDKELAALPLFGFGISILLLVLTFVAGAANPNHLFYNATLTAKGGELFIKPFGYAGLVAVSLLVAIVSTFVTAAVIHGAMQRFNGGDPTIKSSLHAAWKRFGSLTAFSVFSYTVGFLISEIASRLPVIGGHIVAWLAGTAWNVASFFAIPVIVTSETPVNPIKATKSSFGIIKKVWGESLIITATVGIIALCSGFAYAAITISLVAWLATNGIIGGYVLGSIIALQFLGLCALFLVFSVLEGFVKAAVYHFATTGESPVTFNRELMRQAFTEKKARKIFGS